MKAFLAVVLVRIVKFTFAGLNDLIGTMLVWLNQCSIPAYLVQPFSIDFAFLAQHNHGKGFYSRFA